MGKIKLSESQLRNIIKNTIKEALSANQMKNMAHYLNNSDSQNNRYKSDSEIGRIRTTDNMYRYGGKTSNTVVKEIQEILDELKHEMGRLDNARRYTRRRFGMTTQMNSDTLNKRRINAQYGKEFDMNNPVSNNSSRFADPTGTVAASPESPTKNFNRPQGVGNTSDTSNRFGTREKFKFMNPHYSHRLRESINIQEGLLRDLWQNFKNNKDDKRRDAAAEQMLPQLENELNRVYNEAEQCIIMAKTITEKDVQKYFKKLSELRKVLSGYYNKLYKMQQYIVKNTNLIDTVQNRKNRKAEYINNKKKANDMASQTQGA